MDPHAEGTNLSGRDRDILAALEADLSRDDPTLARRLRNEPPSRRRRVLTSTWFGVLLIVVGLALVVTTVMVSTLVAFGGVLVMAGGAIIVGHRARGALVSRIGDLMPDLAARSRGSRR